MRPGYPACDTKSHVASELADRRAGLCRMRSFGPVLDGLAPPSTCVAVCAAGFEAWGNAEGPLFHPGVTGKGQTGRVNCVNLR